MLFDLFNRRHDGHLTREEIRQVINLIFKDFHMPYEVNHLDVDNFLVDFDINHDREITMEDFKGVDVLTFDLHHERELGMETKIKMKVNWFYSRDYLLLFHNTFYNQNIKFLLNIIYFTNIIVINL